MRLQVFCFTQSSFSWSWKIDPEQIQSSISEWLSRHSTLVIREIKHDTVASVWYPPQLIVSIYYEDPANDGAAPDTPRGG